MALNRQSARCQHTSRLLRPAGHRPEKPYARIVRARTATAEESGTSAWLDEEDVIEEPVQPCGLVTTTRSVLTVFAWPAALYAPSEVQIVGSFNSWGAPVRLRKTKSGTQYVRSMVLPVGPVTYKFIVDGAWQHSPRDPIMFSDMGPNNHMLVSANTEIRWRADTPAKSVYVTGSFVDWQELVPMQQTPEGEFVVRCCLPVGVHQVQFLVDGSWHTCSDMPEVVDENGRECNDLAVSATQTFTIFYKSGWDGASMLARHVDGDGESLTEWERTPIKRTQSRGLPWQEVVIPALVDSHVRVRPSRLQFVMDGPKGARDTAARGNAYALAAPGGYKLQSGVVTPFPQCCAPPIMLVSDLDGTMVDESREADSATAMFRDYWENVAALCNSVLVYNTGRSIGQFEGLYKHKNGVLAMPDAVITAVGTKVFFMNREVTRQSADGEAWMEDMEYARRLDQDWNLGVVRDAAAQQVKDGGDRCHWLDDGSEHPHRIALNVHQDVIPRVKEAVQERVDAAGYKCQFITSGPGDYKYLDILSVHGGKRHAMEYVRGIYGIPRARVVTAGDSGNDILMLEGDSPAIVVGNAQPALLEWVATQEQRSGRVILADKPQALGIMEGLARHGLY